MLLELRSMLAAMVATTIIVMPIGAGFMPAPSDSYPHSAGFSRVGQPVVSPELEQNVQRQARARRAAELAKLLPLAVSPVSTAEPLRAGSDVFDDRTSPQVKRPETQGEDSGTAASGAPLASQQLPACTDVKRSVTGLEAKNANAPTRATEVAEGEQAIEPPAVIPPEKPARARLHARRRIRLTRRTSPSSGAPSAAAQSSADPNTSFNDARRADGTNAPPVAAPASGASRGSAF